MIELKNITKSFANKNVLKDVNLTIANGKITSLIGANGAGKSTTIGIIANYFPKTGGEVQRNTLSIMPDAETVYGNWTGKKFLTFMSDLKGGIAHEEWQELALKLGIQDSLNKKIKGYSFGMKKKLSFIQAFIGNFDTYIFDEPTSGVDVPSAELMMSLLNELKVRNKAILLTSHNLDELQRVSDVIYILRDGVTELFNQTENLADNRVYYIQVQNPKTVSGLNLTNSQYEFTGTVNQLQPVIQTLLNEQLIIESIQVEQETLAQAVFSK
ncbi:MAG TPA: ABC transporter ATP-binding protein [Lactobacillaceae bacterium]|jgi:ABC-2 type transport system ATP-binding protein